MPSVLEAAGRCQRGQPLLLLLIGHEQAAALVLEAEVVDAEHPHAQAHLGADRVEDGSNASSVMLNSVTRTGTMRFLLQTNSVSGASIGTISSVPDCASALFASSCALVG